MTARRSSASRPDYEAAVQAYQTVGITAHVPLYPIAAVQAYEEIRWLTEVTGLGGMRFATYLLVP